jgi:hypothetical protein
MNDPLYEFFEDCQTAPVPRSILSANPQSALFQRRIRPVLGALAGLLIVVVGTSIPFEPDQRIGRQAAQMVAAEIERSMSLEGVAWNAF